jgi:proline iminopeptidase
MSIIVVDGCDLFVTEVGDGPPALVMHGGLGLDHTYLTPGLDPLGSQRTLHYYDHRGNGRSGRPPLDSISLPQLAADADSLRKSIGVDRITVIGHSFGGFIALEYAVTFPNRIDKLVLLDTAPAGDYLDELRVDITTMGATEEILLSLETKSATDEEFENYFRTIAPLYFVNYDEARMQDLMQGTIYCAATANASSECLPTWSVVERLDQVTAATLVLVGQCDWITPPDQSKRIADGIRDSELLVVEETGHFPWLEDPGTVDIVNAFLAR